MRVLKIVFSVLLPASLLAAAYAAADDNGVISGTVRDTAGKLLEGAKLTLSETSQQPPTIPASAISGSEGKYQIEGLRWGKYSLAAEKNGFVAVGAEAVEISAASMSVTVDFKLTPQTTAAQSEVKISSETKAPPKFEAAGVRGLIDPGGYSAPANAAAASGLIEGIANIKRVGNESLPLTTGSFACADEARLKAAVEANPNQSDANRRLGEFYIARARPMEAIIFLQKAHEASGGDELASRDLALAWMESGEFDSARRLLSAMAEKHSTPEIHRLLAAAEEGAMMFAPAAYQYRLAAKEEPSEENFFGMGYELILAGLPADAGGAFQLGLEQHPRSVELLIGSGTAEFLQGHTSEGVLSLLQASDVNPSDPRPYRFLTNVSGISQPESARVRKALKRFLDLAPANPEAYYFYAVSLAKGPEANDAKDTANIEALLKRAIALDPAFVNAHLQLGALQAARGDHKDAALEYEETVRLAPNLKEAHYRLAGAYRQTGRPRLATREMELFQRAQESETARGNSSGIGQFISVLGRPVVKTADAAPCPPAGP